MIFEEEGDTHKKREKKYTGIAKKPNYDKIQKAKNNSYIPYKETLINSQTGEAVEIRSENSGIAKANLVEYIREAIELEMKRNYGSITEI